MNDFTKEELLIIKSWCASKVDSVGLVNFVGTDERELQKKIQSMIDDYCERKVGCIVMQKPEKGGDVYLIYGYKDDLECRYADGEKLLFLNDHIQMLQKIKELNDYK